jgi:hypothetical protein
MTVIDIASVVVSVLLGASRLLATAKPLWNKLPRVVAVAVPVVVACVPQVVEMLGGVKSALDLATTVVFAAALLVPGIAEAEKSV